MHPELVPLAKTYADAQLRFFEINRRLYESSRRFINYDPGASDYYQVSEAHGRLFAQWVKTVREVEVASKALLDRARKLAGLD